MANDKVELWVEAFSAALDAKAEMGFIYLDNGMVVEELHRHVALVLAKKDAEIARLTKENEKLREMFYEVDRFLQGSTGGLTIVADRVHAFIYKMDG